MGTRNLTIAIIDQQPRIAQYGQWDGYPESSGLRILEFVRGMNPEHFTSALKRCRFLGDSAKDKAYIAKVEATPNWPKEYPLLTRDTGADILSLVNATHKGEILLINQLAFAADSLFCEWAYVVDMDRRTLEVYKGFNEKPLPKTARFYGLKQAGDNMSRDKYHPIKMVAKFSFDDLPSDDDFIAKCHGKRRRKAKKDANPS